MIAEEVGNSPACRAGGKGRCDGLEQTYDALITISSSGVINASNYRGFPVNEIFVLRMLSQREGLCIGDIQKNFGFSNNGSESNLRNRRFVTRKVEVLAALGFIIKRGHRFYLSEKGWARVSP